MITRIWARNYKNRPMHP